MPSRGWIRGSVRDLAVLVHRAAAPPPRIEELAKELEDRVRFAAVEFTRRLAYGSQLGANVASVLVPFPLEYALYQIPVSPARRSRASWNPQLEVTFQYRQDYLEPVLGQSDDDDGQTRRMAMTVIANALVFHESLAEVQFQVKSGKESGGRAVRPVESFRNGGVFDDNGIRLEVWPESHWPGFALREADVFKSYMAW